jgi:hypothetical protein
VIGLLFLLLTTLASAQPVGAGWLGVEASLEVSDEVELTLGEELRGEVFPKGPAELLTDVGARYRFSKVVSVEGAYRLEVPLPTAPVGHRLALDLRLTHRMDKLRIKFRQRYTLGVRDVTTHTLRPRIGAELRFDTLRPYASVEPFFRVAPETKLHKVRFTLGTKIRTSGPTFRVFTHFEQQTDGDQLLVGGLGASFGAKLKRKD